MRIRSMLHVVPVLLAISGSAFCGPVTISFTSSLLSAGRGQTVTFSATVLNTTASAVFLNSDSVNIAAPLTVDDIRFFLNFPVSLAANQFVTASILDVMVPSNAPYGLYAGNFDILGGSDANAQTTVGSAVFAVNVVPEPGTLGFMLAGGLCLALRMRGRKRLVVGQREGDKSRAGSHAGCY